MTVQEDFDALYAFVQATDDALTAVKEEWLAVLDTEVAAVVALPQDEWAAYLDALPYTFAADNEPAGLTPEQIVVWNERCSDIRYRAQVQIVNSARRLIEQQSVQADHLADAIENLHAAKTMFIARDIWSPEWVLFVVMGVYHGIEAGGADAFPEPADATLFGQARNLLVNNAERCLEMFDLSRDAWPSDAAGVAKYRAARAALAAFVGA